MKYIIANWKSHKNEDEVQIWWKKFAEAYRGNDDVKVIVAVPFVYLSTAFELKNKYKLQVEIAAQDVSPFPFGAYTGAISAEMVSQWGEWVIIGHSERRNYFRETNNEVANKMIQATEAKLGVVLCVDEPYARKQRTALDVLPDNLIVAYEPLEAIGTGNPENPKDVEMAVRKIKEWYEDRVVIYGGSTNPDNAKEYLRIHGVDGLLPGGASLDAEKFAQMCRV